MTESDNSELFNVEIGGDSKSRSFAAAEMVTCESCLRANPPTRPNCLYCGESLTPSAAVEAPLAEGEVAPAAPAKGFYVVLTTGPEQWDESLWHQVAHRAELKLSDLQSALKAGGSLPLMHVSSPRHAEEIVDQFRALGIATSLIKNEDLQLGSAHKKIRALEFSDAGVTGWVGTPAEQLFAGWEDLTLLVTGRLQMHNVEDVVRRKRGGLKPIERRELSDDESVFDLYSRSAEDGWRLMADSFDFSCLGERKGITAFGNFRALINFFRERAENLEVDESYVAVRPVLAKVWPLEADRRAGGWRRSGAGKFEISTVTSTGNENQFTNYSRLLRSLKTQKSEEE